MRLTRGASPVATLLFAGAPAAGKRSTCKYSALGSGRLACAMIAEPLRRRSFLGPISCNLIVIDFQARPQCRLLPVPAWPAFACLTWRGKWEPRLLSTSPLVRAQLSASFYGTFTCHLFVVEHRIERKLIPLRSYYSFKCTHLCCLYVISHG